MEILKNHLKEELTALYTDRYDSVLNMISRKIGGNRESAEDIVQEAYCKCLEKIDTFDPEKGTLNVWFNSVLFNTLRDAQRGHKVNVDNLDVNYELTELLDGRPSANQELVKTMSDELSDVKNDKHRRVLSLFYVSGYSSSEIAAMEGMTQTNVTTIVKRFK